MKRSRHRLPLLLACLLILGTTFAADPVFRERPANIAFVSDNEAAVVLPGGPIADFHVSTGQRLRRMDAVAAPRISLASSDASLEYRTLLFSGTRDGALEYWNRISGERLRSMDLGIGAVTVLEFYKPERIVVAGGAAGVVVGHRSPDGERLFELHGDGGSITAVATRRYSPQVAVGTEQGLVRVHDRGENRLVGSMAAHGGAVTALGYDALRNRLLSAGEDGAMVLWDSETLRAVEHRDFGGAVVLLIRHYQEEEIRIDPTNERKETFRGASFHALACTDGMIRILSGRSLSLAREFQAHEGRVLDLSISPDGKRIVSVGGDAMIRLWDATSGGELAAYSLALQMSP